MVNCFEAFVAGDLTHAGLQSTELNQYHHEDIEEMDISWQLAMAVFRAQQFVNKTWKNNWAQRDGKKLGFNSKNMRCYNCHEPGHKAKECTKPRVPRNRDGSAQANTEKALVPVTTFSSRTSKEGEKAMVA